MDLVITIIVILFGLVVLWSSLKTVFLYTFTVWENEVGLHFKDGKLVGEIGAGCHRFWGRGHHVRNVDRRAKIVSVAAQEISTADDIPVKISMVVVYEVIDFVGAFTAGANVDELLYVSVQLALRNEVALLNHDELALKRGNVNAAILEIARNSASKLGLQVNEVALRDVILPAEIKQAQQSAFKAKKDAMARMETARGEASVMRTLANAAKQFEGKPEIVQLAFLKTIEKASENGCNEFKISLSDFKGGAV